jgi:hypothetical protein
MSRHLHQYQSPIFNSILWIQQEHNCFHNRYLILELIMFSFQEIVYLKIKIQQKVIPFLYVLILFKRVEKIHLILKIYSGQWLQSPWRPKTTIKRPENQICNGIQLPLWNAIQNFEPTVIFSAIEIWPELESRNVLKLVQYSLTSNGI